MHPTRSYALDCCRLAGREGFRRPKFRFQGVAGGWRGVVRNPLLGSLGDNFKMRVKGITGHRYVSHSTVSVDGRRRRSSQKNLSLMCPMVWLWRLSLSFILGSTLNKLRVSPAHWRQMPNSGPPSQNWPPVYTRVHTPASATPRGLGCSRDATVIPHAASRQAIRARCTAGTMSSTLQAWSFP